MIDAVSVISVDERDDLILFSVWDIWDKGRLPPRATLKHASIYDYYDILEEIGRYIPSSHLLPFSHPVLSIAVPSVSFIVVSNERRARPTR